MCNSGLNNSSWWIIILLIIILFWGGNGCGSNSCNDCGCGC